MPITLHFCTSSAKEAPSSNTWHLVERKQENASPKTGSKSSIPIKTRFSQQKPEGTEGCCDKYRRSLKHPITYLTYRQHDMIVFDHIPEQNLEGDFAAKGRSMSQDVLQLRPGPCHGQPFVQVNCEGAPPPTHFPPCMASQPDSQSHNVPRRVPLYYSARNNTNARPN